MGSWRTVYFFSEKKAQWVGALLGLLYLLLGGAGVFLVAAPLVLLAGALVRTRAARAAMARYRHRPSPRVVFSPGARARALALDPHAEPLAALAPWSLLEGSPTLLLVLHDADDDEPSPLERWLQDEERTRIFEANTYGWRENIVYTPEGAPRASPAGEVMQTTMPTHSPNSVAVLSCCMSSASTNPFWQRPTWPSLPNQMRSRCSAVQSS